MKHCNDKDISDTLKAIDEHIREEQAREEEELEDIYGEDKGCNKVT